MATQPQAVEYDSASQRPSMIAEVVELIRYRDLVAIMIDNIIKVRYKRSTLGVIWTLLHPLLHMVVLTIAFSALFSRTLNNYPIYVLVGLIGWNFFTQTTLYAMNTLVWGGTLLKRVYIPRTIFAVASVGNGLVNLALSIVPLVVIMLALDHPLHGTWWFVPIAVLLLTMFSLGVALLVSTLAVLFTDVVDMYQVLLQAGFFLTAVMYPVSILPPAYARYINLNPMHNLLELFRAPIYEGVIPDPSTILAAVAWAVVALVAGWFVYTHKADEFAYRI